VTQPEPAASDLLVEGEEAFARGDWQRASQCFAAAVEREETPEALERLASAAWFTEAGDVAVDARERAYALYQRRGQAREAGRMATWLARDVVAFRGETAVGAGWLARAHRLLDPLEPGLEHAWLAIREATAVLGEDPVRARDLGASAVDLARTLELGDVEMNGLAIEGLALVSLGEVEQGMRLLDEATTAAVSGEMRDLFAIANSCCYLIFACERTRDFDRAAQWARRLGSFCERWELRSLLGFCRAHHGSVLVAQGRWPEAEAELVAAIEQMQGAPGQLPDVLVRMAELRRQQGRVEEARELLRQAEFHALALLVEGLVALDEDDPARADDYAERYLRRYGAHGRLERAPGLELLARARAARGRVADEAVEELRELAQSTGSVSIQALSARAGGAAALAAGDAETARRLLEDAVELLYRTGAPYDCACARIELARALAADGRFEDAREEAARARDSLVDLGAANAAARAAAVLAAGAPTPAVLDGPLTNREVEVLALVAAGLTNRQIAERLVLSEHTVHRHLSNILGRLGVSSRAAAVAEASRLGLL
jgi:DNA-binding NarL/FixJ family response regulator